MNRRPRKPIQWQRALGLIPPAVIAVVSSFYATRAKWYDTLTPGDKASFWPGAITAGATLALFVVTLVAVVVAFRQFAAFQKNAKIQATTDLLREWSRPKYQQIMSFIDFDEDLEWCRGFTRLLYQVVGSEARPKGNPKDKKAAKVLRKQREGYHDRTDTVEDGIKDLTLMASRTWNLLEHELIDPEVLFGQIDYDIVSAYFGLEDVLAIRQVKQNYLYSDFTSLVQAAQRHYSKRPHLHRVDELVDAKFNALPFDDEELEAYMATVKKRYTEWREQRFPTEPSGGQQ